MSKRIIQTIVTGLLIGLAITGCNKGAGNTPEAAAAPLLVSQEDVLVVRNSALTSGPSITGSVECSFMNRIVADQVRK